MDFMREQISKAEDMVANTTNWIKEVAAPLLEVASFKLEELRDTTKEVAANILDKASSVMEELSDTLEDNPLYLGLLGIALVIITLGIVMGLAKTAVTMAICIKDVAVNMVIFIKDVIVDMAIFIKDVVVDMAICVKNVALNLAICIKDVTINLAIGIKDVTVNIAIWIKEATTNCLDIENPIFFSLLGIFMVILCLVSYFIYTRLVKKIEGKVENQEEEEKTSNPDNSSSTNST